VEKCTLCAERLAQGLQPKCVEVCPAGALIFGDLADETSEVARLVRAGDLWRRKPTVGTRPQVYYKIG
jgi:molybdopterin-containing oxidoreductase family iron-sulfur binding subunit